jgi:hypothetical protein
MQTWDITSPDDNWRRVEICGVSHLKLHPAEITSTYRLQFVEANVHDLEQMAAY